MKLMNRFYGEQKLDRQPREEKKSANARSGYTLVDTRKYTFRITEKLFKI